MTVCRGCLCTGVCLDLRLFWIDVCPVCQAVGSKVGTSAGLGAATRVMFGR